MEAIKNKIISKFIWVEGREYGENSFGEVKKLTKEKIDELKEVSKVIETEEMFTDDKYDVEWVNVEGLDYGYIWAMQVEGVGNRKGVRWEDEQVERALLVHMLELLTKIEGKSNLYYTERTGYQNKCIVLFEKGVGDEGELDHYKFVYQ